MGAVGPYFPIDMTQARLVCLALVRNDQKYQSACGRREIQTANAQFGKNHFFETPCSLTGEASIQRNTNTDSSTEQSQIWATNTNGWNGGIGQQEGW